LIQAARGMARATSGISEVFMARSFSHLPRQFAGQRRIRTPEPSPARPSIPSVAFAATGRFVTLLSHGNRQTAVGLSPSAPTCYSVPLPELTMQTSRPRPTDLAYHRGLHFQEATRLMSAGASSAIPCSSSCEVPSEIRRAGLVVRSPGRVNLIGEHTDYNHGFVLPAAVDRGIAMALRPRSIAGTFLHALDLDRRLEGDLGELAPHPERWPNYLLGVLHQLQRQDIPWVASSWCTVAIPGRGMSRQCRPRVRLAFFPQRAIWHGSWIAHHGRNCPGGGAQLRGWSKCGIWTRWRAF